MIRVPEPRVTVALREGAFSVTAAEGMDTNAIKALLFAGIEVIVENEIRARLENQNLPEPAATRRVWHPGMQ